MKLSTGEMISISQTKLKPASAKWIDGAWVVETDKKIQFTIRPRLRYEPEHIAFVQKQILKLEHFTVNGISAMFDSRTHNVSFMEAAS